jgi:predicted adenylyl cyclase CyaB
MRNLELKVACDPATFAHARAVAARLAPLTRLWQRDTYFATPRGRLKLREIRRADAPATAELIGYDRPDDAGARWSTYHRATIAADEVAALTAALATTIGLRIVVEKTRDVAISGRTRIHLDEVAGLGAFVELETVIDEGASDHGAADELAAVATSLGIAALPAIAGSYSDLLEAASRGADGTSITGGPA